MLTDEERRRRNAEANRRFRTRMTPEQRTQRAATQRAWVATRTPEWHAERATKDRATRLVRQFGITAGEYDQMLVEQDAHCALCPATTGAGGKMLAVDHDHATGKVRGLLCDRCNTSLGHFEDDPEFMLRAAMYIEGHR